VISLRYAVSALISVILLISFSGCSVKESFVLQDFESTVSFEMSGITVKGNLSYKSQGESTFTVTEPENISGTVFTDSEVSLPDIKINYGKMGDYSPVKALFNAISDLGTKEILIPKEGELEYISDTSSAGYKIMFDCTKKKITTIETEKFIFKFE
jgi:hypothetical protein